MSLAMSVVVAPATMGATNGSWQLLPTRATAREPGRVYLVYESRAGAVVQDSVTLTNLTDRPMSFRLRAADAVNAPGNGAWALRPPQVDPVDAGAWIKIGRSDVTVPGQGSIDIPVEIRVPVDARPGDHAGGVIAANGGTERGDVGGSAQLEIVREVAVRVYLRIRGEATPVVRVAGVELDRRVPVIPYVTGHGRVTVRYHVRNVGDIRVAAVARAHIVDLAGRTVKRFAPVRLDDLLPGADVPVEASWLSPVPIGRLTARVEVDAGDVRASAATSVWFVPWYAAASALFVVGALVIAVVARRRRAQSLAG
jgi:hypothetical protein